MSTSSEFLRHRGKSLLWLVSRFAKLIFGSLVDPRRSQVDLGHTRDPYWHGKIWVLRFAPPGTIGSDRPTISTFRNDRCHVAPNPAYGTREVQTSITRCRYATIRRCHSTMR